MNIAGGDLSASDLPELLLPPGVSNRGNAINDITKIGTLAVSEFVTVNRLPNQDLLSTAICLIRFSTRRDILSQPNAGCC